MMSYGAIPGVEKPVSRLVQGTVMVSTEDLEAGCTLLDAIHAQGCTAFDTAHVYHAGANERAVGQWVNSRGIREQVVIIGKGAHHNEDRKRVTPFDIAADIHDSLARFQFDYIDLYLLHRDDPEVPVGPIVEALHEHAEAGRIRAYGGSNWSAARIRAANAYATGHGLRPFVASSPQFSLAEMLEPPWDDCLSIGGAQGESDRAWYSETGLAVCCWSSLAGGFFSGRITRANAADHADELYHRCYASDSNFTRLERAAELAAAKGVSAAQIALAYVMHQPMNLFALVGCASGPEMAANVAALGITLTPGELAWLDLRD